MSFLKRYVEREHIPLYIVLSFLFSVAVWSLWLPHFLNDISVEDAHAVSFSTESTLDPVLSDTKVAMKYYGGVYYLLYTALDGSNTNVYIVTSTNGVEWSNPIEAFTALHTTTNQGHEFVGFSINSFDDTFAVVGQATSSGYLVIYDSDDLGASWSSSTISNASLGRLPDARIVIDFDDSSNLMVVAYEEDGDMYIATSTDGSTWGEAIVDTVDFTNDGNDYNASPMDVHINSGGDTIQVIYDTATSTNGYELVYASSTDSGVSWTTTTISGYIPPQSFFNGLSEMSSASFDDNGLPGVVYASLVSSAGGGPFDLVYDVVYGTRSSGGTWTTTTVASNVAVSILASMPEPSFFSFFSTNKPLFLYTDSSQYPRLAVNTSTLTTFAIQSSALNIGSEMVLAYDTTLQEVGVAYVTGGNLIFTTSSLRSPDLNVVPTTTAMTITTSTDGTGVVTIVTTVTDTDGDTVTMNVDYSTDNGSTWASSTLGTISDDGSATTSTGNIANITSTSNGNAVTFQWLSATDYADSTTNTVKIRITPTDSWSGVGTARTSSAFEVDNEAPSAPSGLTITNNTTTSTLTWTAVSDASVYTVSSTASGSTATTTATTTSFSSLTPNTQYSYQVLGTDLFGNIGSYSTASTSYTNASAPTSVSASATGATTVTVSWSSSNGSGTTFEVYNSTTGAVVGTTSNASYGVTGLSASTAYVFKVRAQYLSDSSSYSSYGTASSVTTQSAGGGGSAPSSISIPAQSTEAIQGVEVDISETSSGETIHAPVIATTMSVGQSFNFSVGSGTHSLSMTSVSGDSAQFTLRSDPIVFNLKNGEEKIFDVDNDGIYDIHVFAKNISTTKADIKTTVLNKMPIVVENNMSYTKKNNIAIRIEDLDSIAYVAISEDPDFVGIGYESYKKGDVLHYTLSSTKGLKTLYVRVKTAQGSTATIEDSISLVGEDYAVTCPLTKKNPYKTIDSPAVYYVSDDCQKRPFRKSIHYFSYFSSWIDVLTVSKKILDSIELDPRGVMPWGPLYDPKYGAVVKTIDDPKVYLLLNDEKYWIQDETVFNSLGYTGSWIEDISPELLAKYKTGAEINYTDHHPNFTLITYKDDTKIYRIEVDIHNQQVKRHIKDAHAFEKLGFRWDRVVEIADSEQYLDGSILE